MPSAPADAEKYVTEIEGRDPPQIDQLPFSLLERQSNVTTKLVANSGSTRPIDGKNVKYRYSFKEPVFLSFLVVKVAGYTDYDRFIVEVTNTHGKTRKLTAYPKNDRLSVDIDELCKSIWFEPPRAWFRSTILESVELHGFKESGTGEFIRFAHNLDELKAEAIKRIKAEQSEAQKVIDAATEAQDSLDSINKEIGEAQSSLSATRNEIQTETNKLNEVVAKSGAASKQLEATEERLSNLHSEIKVETQRKEQLQNDITSSQTRLKELEANINLFPSEISGYVNQAGANNRVYLQYAVVPLFIMCTMLFLLISGAVDLTTVITEKPDVNLAAIVVSRMPYVAVASAIIYACYRMTKLFITEVMNNNRQRLSLTKVSIIAKDISQAAESGLKLSDEQIYANRLKVKMALLSEHINHLITTEPELIFPENLFSPISPESENIERQPLQLPKRKSKAKASTTKQADEPA